MTVPNTDQRGGDYSEMSVAYRPSHADATYDFKYGVRAIQVLRMTMGRLEERRPYTLGPGPVVFPSLPTVALLFGIAIIRVKVLIKAVCAGWR